LGVGLAPFRMPLTTGAVEDQVRRVQMKLSLFAKRAQVGTGP
jgi:hypothetical protein